MIGGSVPSENNVQLLHIITNKRYSISFTRNAQQRFAVAQQISSMLSYAICCNKHGKIRQTLAVQYLTQCISVQQSNNIHSIQENRSPWGPPALLCLSAGDEKSFWLISRVRNAKSSKTYFMVGHQRIFGGTRMLKLSSPLRWLSKLWVNDGNTSYREKGKELDVQQLYFLWIWLEKNSQLTSAEAKNVSLWSVPLIVILTPIVCRGYSYKQELPCQDSLSSTTGSVGCKWS